MPIMPFPLFLAAMASLASPGSAGLATTAQHHRSHSKDVLREKLGTRVAVVEAKFKAAQKAKLVPAAQARQIAGRIAWIRKDAARNIRLQGFLSAGESASYNRTLDEIENKLG